MKFPHLALFLLQFLLLAKSIQADPCQLFYNLVEGENHFKHPPYRQNYPMACGEMCLYSVLKKKGWQHPNFENNTWANNGVTAENLAQTFRNLGYRSGRWKPRTIAELNDWSKQGTSFIVLLSNGIGGFHFVVFEGLIGETFFYMDPEFGEHHQNSAYNISARWVDLVWVQ